MECLVVDDDMMVRTDLEQRIGKMPGLSLVASCGSAAEAAGIIIGKKVDLLFLDVLLPDMSGLKFLQTIEKERPLIILITSRKEYAAEAFDYEVTDFLVKPFSDERFLRAVIRASRQLVTKNGTPAADHLFVKVNSVLEKISLRDILYVEALADYIQIQAANHRYVVHSTMKSIEQSLPSDYFFRVHNSYIVRLDKIARIEDNSVVINDKLIPVSRSKVKPLMQQINLLRNE